MERNAKVLNNQNSNNKHSNAPTKMDKKEKQKTKMKEVANEGYSSVADGTDLAWPSPSENYSWYRMKSEIKSAFLETLARKKNNGCNRFWMWRGNRYIHSQLTYSKK